MAALADGSFQGAREDWAWRHEREGVEGLPQIRDALRCDVAPGREIKADAITMDKRSSRLGLEMLDCIEG